MILAIAFCGAVLLAVVRGGSFQRLAEVPLRRAWLAIVAFVLQAYIMYFPDVRGEGLFSLQAAALAVSYLLLLILIWQNRHLPGAWVIGAGLACNLAVILLNGGFMPITEGALAQVGHTFKARAPDAGARVLGTKDIMLPREQTVAWWLSDIFVLGSPFPLPSVFSFGDVLVAFGIFWLLQSVMLGSTHGHSQAHVI